MQRSIQVLCASSLGVSQLQKRMLVDFYGRYCERVFEVKPLVERKADFVAFVRKVAETQCVEIDEAMVDAMHSEHDWPRNYREVKEFLEELFARARSASISLETLDETLAQLSEAARLVGTKVLRAKRII